MTLQRLLWGGLLLMLLVAPLPFGSVQPGPRAALVVASVGLGIVWLVWRIRRGESPLPWKSPVLLGGTLLVALGIVQTIPMPRPVLGWLSPEAASLRDRYEPGDALFAAAGDEEAGRIGKDWRPISLHPWATRQATLRLAACLVVALITIDVCADRGGRRLLAAALVAGGAFQAAYGLTEYFTGRQHIFGYAKKYYTEVATGTFINRNHFAGYLEMTLPMAVALSTMVITRWRPTRGESASRRLERAGGRPAFLAGTLLVLGLIMATALVCSRSRMGIASMLVALLAVGMTLALRGRERAFAGAAVILAGVTLLLFAQGGAAAPVMSRFLGTLDEFRGGVGRAQIWGQTVEMARAFPAVGVGLGAFPHVFPMFRTSGEGIAVNHAHNDYLEFGAEAGLVGCAVILGALILLLRSVLSRPAKPLNSHVGYAAAVGVAAIALHSLTDFNLAIPANAFTLSCLLGLLIWWLQSPTPLLVHGAPPRRPWVRRALVPACVLACVAFLTAVPVVAAGIGGVQAEQADGAGLTALTGDELGGFGGMAREIAPPATHGPRAGGFLDLLDGDNAERLFASAGRLGRAAMADLQVLIRLERGGTPASPEAARYVGRRLQEAIEIQRRGLRHFPVSARGHLVLGPLRMGRCTAGVLATDLGEECLEEPLTDVETALRLSPMGATIHAQAARLLLAAWSALGEPARDRARPIILRGVAMNPGDRDLRKLAAETLGGVSGEARTNRESRSGAR